jgi:hypothetical protein
MIEILNGSDIFFLGELVRKTREELSAILAIAKCDVEKDLKLIEKKLEYRGLYLGTKFKEW